MNVKNAWKEVCGYFSLAFFCDIYQVCLFGLEFILGSKISFKITHASCLTQRGLIWQDSSLSLSLSQAATQLRDTFENEPVQAIEKKRDNSFSNLASFQPSVTSRPLSKFFFKQLAMPGNLPSVYFSILS